jgi:UDP-N-acetylmuramoyl-tripeptide--D-alanyl-D-alanine ligase
MRIKDLYKRYLNHPTICTDTRKIETGCIFVALIGQNHDGNHFAEEAISKGAAYAIVSNPQLEHPKFIHVSDTLKTLQELATLHRQKFDIPVLGITGSNGKTTTKELIFNVISQKFKVHATLGNLNNHIGVPLTILSMPLTTEFLIVEMGASGIGEIEELCAIAQPNAGLITCIGQAHLEGFGGIEGVVKGKSELFEYLKRGSGVFFLNHEDQYLRRFEGQNVHQITYGHTAECDVFTSLVQHDGKEIHFQLLQSDGASTLFKTQLYGQYNLINLTAAITVGAHYHVSLENIKFGIEGYLAENNRSQVIMVGSNTVVLDAYNANPSSMESAIVSFAKMFENRILVLGDMKELGDESDLLHQQLIDKITNVKWESVILVGKEFSKTTRPNHFRHFDDINQCKKSISIRDYQNMDILIKGSRSMRLEELVI